MRVILLISGASHTGKTLLAKRLVERHGWFCLPVDLLKMGLIHSGYTSLTPEDDGELEALLWPVVREMVKTAIENGQDMIVEGCYIPFDCMRDFDARYASEIRHVCLVMSREYILTHFDDIKRYADAAERRSDDSCCTPESVLEDNARCLEQCRKYGCEYVLIDGKYRADVQL